ncbi:hypothetical protein KCP69_21700 [Salmonella enterica subsp. enterica]|nr:hypothetical protein KCP69_21700 [Salmonella enterica subsp. enterica]
MLRDRYERDSAGARQLRLALLACAERRETIIAGDISPGLWDGFFHVPGCDCWLRGETPALVGLRKSDAGRRDYHADGYAP